MLSNIFINSRDKKLVFNGMQRVGKTYNFFHNLVKGRRKRLSINRIQDTNGQCLDGVDQVAL